jgi:hypothetical protein
MAGFGLNWHPRGGSSEPIRLALTTVPPSAITRATMTTDELKKLLLPHLDEFDARLAIAIVAAARKPGLTRHVLRRQLDEVRRAAGLPAATPAPVGLDGQREWAKHLHGQRLPTRFIARVLGLSSEEILDLLAESAITSRRPGDRPTLDPEAAAARDAAIVARYTVGESMTALAGAFGVSTSLVERVLVAAGVSIRSRAEAGRLVAARAKAARAAAAPPPPVDPAAVTGIALEASPAARARARRRAGAAEHLGRRARAGGA